jgi:hypothetical protein
MDTRFLVVVSCENHFYHGWQAQLFYYSCLTRLGHAPLIVVHECGEKLHPVFSEIKNHGGRIHLAPSYIRLRNGQRYPPRNTPGTLFEASKIVAGGEYLVLCDPDMIFLRRPPFPDALSGDFYAYMNYEQTRVRQAWELLGIAKVNSDRLEQLQCGAPYVIPRGIARPLSLTWMEALDAFETPHWEDMMYAFGLACVRLDLDVMLTYFGTHNFDPFKRVDTEIIHFCYGSEDDQTWNKRQFFSESSASEVWHARGQAEPGSVLAEIFKQLEEADAFFRRENGAGYR